MIAMLLTITGLVIAANLIVLALVAVSLPVLNKGRALLLQVALDLIKVWKAAHQARLELDREQIQIEANERKLLQ